VTTLDDARTLVGTVRLWLVPGTSKLRVAVRVLDARISFGKAQLLAEPVAGDGQRWVDVELTVERAA
jgi:hypothetical protein